MYLEHFGLGINPFSLSPKLDFLYKSETFEESMAHLVYGLDNHEAIVLITGAIGTGKTMALQSFLTNLGPRFEFALITNTRVTAVELLKLILEDLGVDFPAGADKSDLLILFKNFLHEASLEGKMVLVVVDEAQNLAPEVLEEIRLLTNLGQGETQPVQIILVGQPELDETVNRPDLAQIRQRIRVHYNLDPMTRQETEEYLNHRMAVAGCSRSAFTSGAIGLIFKGSRGVPRLVNTLAGEALLSAFVAGHSMVQPGDVEECQDLRFEAGPQVPDLEPPSYAGDQKPLKHDPPAPVMARRNSRRNNVGRIVLAWALGGAGVVVMGVLFFTGALEGLVTTIHPDSSREIEQTTDREVIAPDPTTQVKATLLQETAPEVQAIPQAVEIGSQEAPQTDLQEKTLVEPSVSTPTINKDPVQSAAAALESGFYIHIYSFKTPERAYSFARRWDHSQCDIRVHTQKVRGAIWYRIYLGPFSSREDALSKALRLRQDEIIDYYKVMNMLPGQGS